MAQVPEGHSALHRNPFQRQIAIPACFVLYQGDDPNFLNPLYYCLVQS